MSIMHPVLTVASFALYQSTQWCLWCRFKYVLLRVTSADAQHSKLIVRGYARCEYHNDVVRVTKEELRGSGLHVDVIGGGRILHEPSCTPRVSVFGYSAAFGAAFHEVSAVIIRRAFPVYSEDDVVVSYEGY
jgi:phosphohistidine phosphatase